MEQNFTIKVTGMSCEHCEKTVHNLVVDERGVKEVSVDRVKEEVKVQGDHKMNRDQIVNAINLSGLYRAE